MEMTVRRVYTRREEGDEENGDEHGSYISWSTGCVAFDHLLYIASL